MKKRVPRSRPVPASTSQQSINYITGPIETAKCYEEIDQIYDYIRGLAPLPANLRKIKSIDFEQNPDPALPAIKCQFIDDEIDHNSQNIDPIESSEQKLSSTGLRQSHKLQPIQLQQQQQQQTNKTCDTRRHTRQSQSENYANNKSNNYDSNNINLNNISNNNVSKTSSNGSRNLTSERLLSLVGLETIGLSAAAVKNSAVRKTRQSTNPTNENQNHYHFTKNNHGIKPTTTKTPITSLKPIPRPLTKQTTILSTTPTTTTKPRLISDSTRYQLSSNIFDASSLRRRYSSDAPVASAVTTNDLLKLNNNDSTTTTTTTTTNTSTSKSSGRRSDSSSDELQTLPTHRHTITKRQLPSIPTKYTVRILDHPNAKARTGSTGITTDPTASDSTSSYEAAIKNDIDSPTEAAAAATRATSRTKTTKSLVQDTNKHIVKKTVPSSLQQQQQQHHHQHQQQPQQPPPLPLSPPPPLTQRLISTPPLQIPLQLALPSLPPTAVPTIPPATITTNTKKFNSNQQQQQQKQEPRSQLILAPKLSKQSPLLNPRISIPHAHSRHHHHHHSHSHSHNQARVQNHQPALTNHYHHSHNHNHQLQQLSRQLISNSNTINSSMSRNSSSTNNKSRSINNTGFSSITSSRSGNQLHTNKVLPHAHYRVINNNIPSALDDEALYSRLTTNSNTTNGTAVAAAATISTSVVTSTKQTPTTSSIGRRSLSASRSTHDAPISTDLDEAVSIQIESKRKQQQLQQQQQQQRQQQRSVDSALLPSSQQSFSKSHGSKTNHNRQHQLHHIESHSPTIHPTITLQIGRAKTNVAPTSNATTTTGSTTASSMKHRSLVSHDSESISSEISEDEEQQIVSPTSLFSSSTANLKRNKLRLFDERFSSKTLDKQLASSSDSLLESIDFSGTLNSRRTARLLQPTAESTAATARR